MSLAIQNQRDGYRTTIDIEPMGAVRMTNRGKWTSITAQRYLNWKKEVGYHLRQYYPKPLEYALDVRIKFTVPMPDSWWPKKKRDNDGKPVPVKPDIDNMVKAVFDAANKIAWTDDNLVVSCTASKVYGYEGKIELEVIPVF